MVKRLVAPSVIIFAAISSGCHPARIGAGRNARDRSLHVASALICPLRQGDLSRGAIKPDGSECTYEGDSRRVVLRLVPLDGRPAANALGEVEAALRAHMAPHGASAATTPKPAISGDHVELNLPGVHIEADNDSAHVNVLGEHIDAQTNGATVRGKWNGVSNTIDAQDGHVEMRVGFSGSRSVDLTFFMQSDQPGPSGDRAVGYVARGPVAGPLVLSTVEAREADGRPHEAVLKDLKALVALNVKS